MDTNPPAAGDAEPQVAWTKLTPAQDVEVREAGRPAGRGVVDNVTPDASVVWVRIDGHAPRRMYLAGDPVELLPVLENPEAF
ncbi:hypothetical protein ACFRAU_15365 [Arthrobacter sp. NPDC056691]|uniref:hypothetical protein n=1 Tax=Arthrobacter sp. NPDC056691 TaxID=3345913 RepID=UPI00367044C7